MEECKIVNMYDLEHTIAAEMFGAVTYPWEALPLIKDYVVKLGEQLDPELYDEIEEHVWVAKSAKVYPTATIIAPTIIGQDTEVRPGAFLRGNIIVGNNCVVGNSTELKNVVLFDNVQVPHYNYVGDSILGYKAHMGAGSITSNVKSDKTLVVVKNGSQEIETGLKKFGAMLGNNVEVGCNSVLNPGTVVCPSSNVYPVSCVRGVIPANSIYKAKGDIVAKK